jgi:hypothetical protein
MLRILPVRRRLSGAEARRCMRCRRQIIWYWPMISEAVSNPSLIRAAAGKENVLIFN